MNGMPTGQILWRLSRGEHVFSTDGTIVLVLVFEALMSVKDTNRNAHAAFVAMAERFHPSDTAKSTSVAVEWFLALFSFVFTDRVTN